MASYTNAATTLSLAAVAVATATTPVVVHSMNQTAHEMRVGHWPPALSNPFVIIEPVRELVSSDFAVLTAADVAMLEMAMNAPVDDLDYSILFTDDA